MIQSDMLALAIQANVTTVLVGLPGVGKTAVTQHIAKELGEKVYKGRYPLVVTNAASKMPEDLGGAQVPNHETKTMQSYAMGAIKSLIEAGQGVHLIDEYGSASAPMRAATLSIQEGRLYGDHHLPNVAVVLCMNPPDVAVNGADMTAPESNRPFWIQWHLDTGAFVDWLMGGEGAVRGIPILPEDWKERHGMKARTLVGSFLKRNPNLIHVMPEESKLNGPWPSPRSWTNAATMFAATIACKYPLASDHVHAAVAGCVGKDAADTFFAWVRDMDLPDPEALLADPKNAQNLLPQRHDRVMACLESVASAACEDRKDKNARWDAAWEVLRPVLATHQDRVMSAAAILASRRPAGCNFPTEAAEILRIRREMGITKAGI